MEGKAVSPLARKTKKCKKRGIVSTRTMPIASPREDGFIRASITLTNPVMLIGSFFIEEK
jgi:hypothetical protein